MQIRFNCPTNGCVALIEYEPLEDCGPTMECPRCRIPHAMRIDDALRRDKRVDACAVCGCRELFTRKDFPQRLGMFIVVAFGLTAIYLFRTSVIQAWLVLATALVIDLLIYFVVGKVTVCYACRAEYRGCEISSKLEAFDLAASEKY